uniref:DUF4235 domain-containing protein n=1 Tax=Meloidogyne hapla TaxID=6305 RepID=A0A1I8BIU5_MELHA
MVNNEAASSSINNLTVDDSEQQIEQNFNHPIRWFKLLCGTASTAGFVYGLRVAWVHSRLKPGELPRTNLLSGAGYVSLIVLISEAMGVNTFKEFGSKTKQMFGDRFRISKGKDETFESLSDLFEKFQKESKK